MWILIGCTIFDKLIYELILKKKTIIQNQGHTLAVHDRLVTIKLQVLAKRSNNKTTVTYSGFCAITAVRFSNQLLKYVFKLWPVIVYF